MTKSSADDPSAQDARLDALSSLPRIDLDPFRTRSIRDASLRVLALRSRASRATFVTHCQLFLLYVLSAAQVLWAAGRVLGWLR